MFIKIDDITICKYSLRTIVMIHYVLNCDSWQRFSFEKSLRKATHSSGQMPANSISVGEWSGSPSASATRTYYDSHVIPRFLATSPIEHLFPRPLSLLSTDHSAP